MVQVRREKENWVLEPENILGHVVSYFSSAYIAFHQVIKDYREFHLPPEKLSVHELPSANLKVGSKRPSELILTLERDCRGHYSVNLVTNPLVGSTKICDSYPHISGLESSEHHELYARDVYNNMIGLLSKGNFVFHIFPNRVMGLEEIVRK